MENKKRFVIKKVFTYKAEFYANTYQEALDAAWDEPLAPGRFSDTWQFVEVKVDAERPNRARPRQLEFALVK